MNTHWLLAPRLAASPGWWRVFLAGAVLCLAAALIQRVPAAPGGNYGWTVGYGIAAAALLVVAMAYSVRRRMPRRGPGALHHWVQAHVYGGTLFVVAVALHSGGAFPGGFLSWCLWVASLWVVVTGLLGVFLQKWIPPALTSALATEVHYDRIPELVAAVHDKVELLVAASSESVRKFHDANLEAVLARPRTSFVYFFDITGGIQSRMRRFDYLKRLLDEDDAQRLEELRTLTRTKLEMDAHYTLQKALWWWVYLHVPAAFLLTMLVAIHVFAVLYY
ncbi:MAG: hypothetical protein F4X11_01840 [Acidobacteria bacterium]|nr:hypothetical protein [Acidobacteriota bacterium]